MSHILKNLLIVLGVTLTLGVVYMVVVRGDSETATTPEKREVVEQTEKILADIKKIKSYKVENTIFSSKEFLSLKDFKVEIEDVDTGRENPFEPVE